MRQKTTLKRFRKRVSLGDLRGDLWNKFGGVQAWGVKADGLIRDFKLTNPPENYQLDFKNWDKTQPLFSTKTALFGCTTLLKNQPLKIPVAKK
jgi:hypothetical protein